MGDPLPGGWIADLGTPVVESDPADRSALDICFPDHEEDPTGWTSLSDRDMDRPVLHCAGSASSSFYNCLHYHRLVRL